MTPQGLRAESRLLDQPAVGQRPAKLSPRPTGPLCGPRSVCLSPSPSHPLSWPRTGAPGGQACPGCLLPLRAPSPLALVSEPVAAATGSGGGLLCDRTRDAGRSSPHPSFCLSPHPSCSPVTGQRVSTRARLGRGLGPRLAALDARLVSTHAEGECGAAGSLSTQPAVRPAAPPARAPGVSSGVRQGGPCRGQDEEQSSPDFPPGLCPTDGPELRASC